MIDFSFTPGLPVVDFALMLEFARRERETRSDIAVEASVSGHVFTDRAKAEAFRLITTAHPDLRANTWLRETVGTPSAA
ncbi:hypothetical protein [Streptomyces sp. NPDC050538]|uniref:hypothetical protein n=1 Tax=Streptomyces sp. NPDC050538 TaxID=3365627 RepID=UPI0037B87B93